MKRTVRFKTNKEFHQILFEKEIQNKFSTFKSQANMSCQFYESTEFINPSENGQMHEIRKNENSYMRPKF